MKLHLGCGSKYIPGWLHVDVVDGQHINLQHTIDALPMILDGTVDVIYACHVFEHYMRREAQRVLAEWFRVLKPQGLLRLAVPDFEAIAAHYTEHRDLQAVLGLLFGRQESLYGFHHSVWDFPTLETALLATGFVDVHPYDWRATEHAWLDDYSQAYLPHLDKDHGRLMSLNVEATKPSQAT